MVSQLLSAPPYEMIDHHDNNCIVWPLDGSASQATVRLPTSWAVARQQQNYLNGILYGRSVSLSPYPTQRIV